MNVKKSKGAHRNTKVKKSKGEHRLFYIHHAVIFLQAAQIALNLVPK